MPSDTSNVEKLHNANPSKSSPQPQSNQISRYLLAWWIHNLLEVNRSIDEIAQAYLQTQRHINNV